MIKVCVSLVQCFNFCDVCDLMLSTLQVLFVTFSKHAFPERKAGKTFTTSREFVECGNGNYLFRWSLGSLR